MKEFEPQEGWGRIPSATYGSANGSEISRIFPRGDANSHSGCTNLLFLRFFGRKLHENERIWTRGLASLAPPLDPPMKSLITLSVYCCFMHLDFLELLIFLIDRSERGVKITKELFNWRNS